MLNHTYNSFSSELGTLLPVEFTSLPFTPNRFFIVYGVPKDTIRGQHAHYCTEQLLICIQGKIEVKAIEKNNTTSIILNEGDSFYMKKLVWGSQKFLTGNDILAVFANMNYQPEDYIHDFEIFNKI